MRLETKIALLIRLRIKFGKVGAICSDCNKVVEYVILLGF